MAQKYKIEKQMVSIEPKLLVAQPLQDEFNNIDQKYENEINTLTEKRKILQGVAPDFKEQAQVDLADYKTNTLGKLETDYQTDLQKINQQKSKNSENIATKLQNVSKSEEQEKNNLYKKVMENGINNSSIYKDQIDKIEKNVEYQRAILNQQESANKAASNLNLTLLELEKEQALEDFDIKYAAKLDKQISQLKTEYKKLAGGSAIVDEIESLDTQLHKISERVELEKAKSLLVYVNGLKRQDALVFLQNNADELKQQVGKAWFTNVQNWIKARL